MIAGRDLVGTVRVALAAASWGTWSLFLRPAGVPAAVSGAVVFAIIGLVTLPAAWLGPAVRWDRRSLALLAANAILDAANVLTFFAAIETTTVAIAVLTHYLAPVLIAILAPVVDRQRVPGAVPAALVSCTGLVLVLAPWQNGGDHVLLGGALGAASAVCYAANVFVLRRLAPRIGATRAVSYHALLGALMMAPFAVGAGVVPDADALAWLASGAVVLGAAGGVAFVGGLPIIGSARAAMLTYLEPIVAVAVGALAWHEPIGASAVAGAALVIASGLWIARTTPRAV